MRRRLTEEQRWEIAVLYREGLSIRSVAWRMCIPPSTVQYWLDRLGVERRTLREAKAAARGHLPEVRERVKPPLGAAVCNDCGLLYQQHPSGLCLSCRRGTITDEWTAWKEFEDDWLERNAKRVGRRK